jgi:hypothetical protein
MGAADLLESNQPDQEQQQVERLLRGWIVGGASAPAMAHFPPSWQPLMQEIPPERQTLMALALYSQYQSLLLASHNRVALQATPDLPDLSLPPLTEPLRPLFRRLLAALNRPGGVGPAPLLQLLLQRGLSAHPADWLPSAQDEGLPKVYWPWSRWVALQQSVRAADTGEELNVENWDAFYPAERLMQLRGMRLTDPDGARALIQACADQEPADKRLRIMELLTINLSAADADYLLSLVDNRSKKIARLASQLLARLGMAVAEDEAEQDGSYARNLAEGFEVKKGLMRRKVQITPRPLKNKKQKAIRSELLQKVQFQALAEALQIEEAMLAAGWQFSANRDGDNHAFVLNALNTLPENLLQTLLDNALSQIDSSEDMLALIALFIPRLDSASSSQLMYRLLNHQGIGFSFSDCLAYSDQPLSELDWDRLTKTSAWRQLLSSIKDERNEEQGYVEHDELQAELNALGLMLPQSLAQQTLKTLTENGLMQADPILDALKLNAHLNSQ